MGVVTVTLQGSFGSKLFTSTALEGGHAAALGRAINYLSLQLPASITLDHALHDQNETPPRADFGSSLTPPPMSDTEVRQFVGYLAAKIPELHNVEVPLLGAALDEFRAVSR